MCGCIPRGKARGGNTGRDPSVFRRVRSYQGAVERLKWLSQILKQRLRQLEIYGVESFRETVVHESQRMPGLIALLGRIRVGYPPAR